MLTVKKILKYQLWLPVLVSLIIVLVILPVYILSADKPIVDANGINVKNGDRIFYRFLNNLKEKNGVLILGTSETGNSFGGNNYWGLLNRDKELNRYFYAYGGAGRCSYVYFPLILDNPELFKDLEIILYINPTYWRYGLNNFHDKYYERYVSPGLAKKVERKARRIGIFDTFIKQGTNKQTVISFAINRLVENYKSLFYSDLNQLIYMPTSKQKAGKDIVINEIGKAQSLKKIEALINFESNATHSFLESESPFPSIDTASVFQYQMLESFIKIVREYDINCTFYLGPYNRIYCASKNPENLTHHDAVLKNIRAILDRTSSKCIDGSYQSDVKGSFNDVQHISEYGAYLTAIDIKKYYEK